jgi:hypothetical protein
MTWISEGELVINDKVYHITNSEWIKNFINLMSKKNDYDTTKDQEAPKAS